MNFVHHDGLDELSLGDWRFDFEHRFVRKHRCALGHRVDIAREAQRLEMPKESFRELSERLEILERRLVEAQRLEERQHIVEPACEQVVAALGKTTGEEAEDG